MTRPVTAAPDERETYARRLLALYRATPGTRGRSRPADRRLAEQIFDHAVPLDTVHAALLLATARRTLRPSDAPHLTPIASLHYFLPVIQELLHSPPPPGYLDYLRARLGLAPQSEETARLPRKP